MTLEDRVRELERRVGELEGSFQFISGQLRGVHKSLIDFQAETNRRFDRVDTRLDKLDGGLDKVGARLESGLGEVNAKLEAMPETVASAVAEALRTSSSQS